MHSCLSVLWSNYTSGNEKVAMLGGTGILGSISTVNVHNEEAPVPLIRSALCYRTFFP